jgi:FtsH-binding integral membrane protein
VRLVQHGTFSLTIIALVYTGFRLTITFTGEEQWKIRHCRVVLTIAFVVKTVAEILYRVFNFPIPWYGLILFGASLFYMLLIVQKLHVHAKTTDPLKKWQMSTSKVGGHLPQRTSIRKT